MTVRDIQEIIEAWAPRDIAWERDNSGLQVGDPEAKLRAILVCLEVTGDIVREAKRKHANLILCHHPLLFKPLSAITTSDAVGTLTLALLRQELNVYAAHTNLDFTKGGTSFALARALKLHDVGFLLKPYTLQKKIVTFVPADHVDEVARAMAEEGAGRIGNYEHCSFRMNGIGTFRGNESSDPALGKKGVFERVPEVRLEMVAGARAVDRIVAALKKSHPYEEVAYDIYPTENRSNDFGMGVIGSLPRPMRLQTFLAAVKKALTARSLRFTGDAGHVVQRIAVCGGSGADLLDDAIHRGADVFVTADIKYHTFHAANGRIALVDAGHYETEQPVVSAVVARLRREIQKKGQKIPVYATQSSTNPISYV